MIQGSIVALVTPMETDGKVAFPVIKDLVEWHISQGTAAIIAMGTTAEAPTLDEEESIEIIRTVLETARGRIPIIAGTGCNNTKTTIASTKAAKALGVDAALVVTPYYNRPTQEGLYRHYMTLADSVDLPLFLYNVPARTGCDLLPQTVARLAAHPNIEGIKEATGDIFRLIEIRERVIKPFAVYTGDDPIVYDFMLAGGHGNMSVVANLYPKEMAALCEAALKQDWETAKAYDEMLKVWYKLCFIEPNPVPVKWILHQMGKIPSGIRLPLAPLSDKFHPMVQEALSSVCAL